MSKEPLIRTLDIRKAATRGVTVKGALVPGQLPRFSGLLADDSGKIEALFSFDKDQEQRLIARVQTTAEVTVSCQRCLQPLGLELAGDTTLAVVLSDEQASQLPRNIEPLLLSEPEVTDLWDVVEDELILALPAYSYHETHECRATVGEYRAPEVRETPDNAQPNPFNVLEQLKPGNKTRS